MSDEPSNNRDLPLSYSRRAVAYPIAAWLSQILLATFARQLPFEVHFVGAVVQFLLVMGGLIFGIRALRMSNGRRDVIILALLGVFLSAGTFLLVILAIVANR